MKFDKISQEERKMEITIFLVAVLAVVARRFNCDWRFWLVALVGLVAGGSYLHWGLGKTPEQSFWLVAIPALASFCWPELVNMLSNFLRQPRVFATLVIVSGLIGLSLWEGRIVRMTGRTDLPTLPKEIIGWAVVAFVLYLLFGKKGNQKKS